jgi:hypothetical protein
MPFVLDVQERPDAVPTNFFSNEANSPVSRSEGFFLIELSLPKIY